MKEVVPGAASFIFAVNSAEDLLNGNRLHRYHYQPEQSAEEQKVPDISRNYHALAEHRIFMDPRRYSYMDTIRNTRSPNP
jgi:hypothetical protein